MKNSSGNFRFNYVNIMKLFSYEASRWYGERSKKRAKTKGFSRFQAQNMRANDQILHAHPSALQAAENADPARLPQTTIHHRDSFLKFCRRDVKGI
jgi:hypothetical protein